VVWAGYALAMGLAGDNNATMVVLARVMDQQIKDH
jgi:hypothetical protein